MGEAMGEERLAKIRDKVTGPCSCCGYDKHDFDQPYALELLEELDRLRADQPELTPEFGIGTDYTDTTRSEQAVSDNLAEALHLLDIARIHRRPDVVSEELIVREVGEWRKPEEGDDRG